MERDVAIKEKVIKENPLPTASTSRRSRWPGLSRALSKDTDRRYR